MPGPVTFGNLIRVILVVGLDSNNQKLRLEDLNFLKCPLWGGLVWGKHTGMGLCEEICDNNQINYVHACLTLFTIDIDVKT